MGPLLRAGPIERARQRVNATAVTAADVVDVLERLRAADVQAWLIGGWAVDALLGHETRPHDDLDLVVEPADLTPARGALEQAGFRFAHEVPAGRWLTVHVQMIDQRRRSVSLHPVDVRAWSAPAGAGSMHEAARGLGLGEVAELLTRGRIAGREVPALSAAAQVVLHCGYDIRERDRGDVELLCGRFGLPLPLPYRGAAEGAIDGGSSPR